MRYLNRIRMALLYITLLSAQILLAESIYAQTEETPNISSEIEGIRTSQSWFERDQRAQHLLKSVKIIGAQNITENEIAALTEMLKNQDPAREWVATTLGFIGPRAKPAVHVLEIALREEACSKGSKTSSHAIRSALMKIGTTPPTVKCPIVANGYSSDVSITIFNRDHGSTFNNVLPGQCIEVAPDDFLLTKLIVTPKELPTKTYSTDEFRNAMKQVRRMDGLLSVSEIGLNYVKDYKCNLSEK